MYVSTIGRRAGYADGHYTYHQHIERFRYNNTYLIRPLQPLIQRNPASRSPSLLQLSRKLDLLSPIGPAGRHLGAHAAVAEEMRRVAQRDLVFGLRGQREELWQRLDKIGNHLLGDAMVGYVQEADGGEGVAELVEQFAASARGRGEREVDDGDGGEGVGEHVSRILCHGSWYC